MPMVTAVNTQTPWNVETAVAKKTLEQIQAELAASHAAKLLAKSSPQQPVPEYPKGPGTELRKILATIGIHPRGVNCKCNEHAAQMDRQGPDWCEANLTEIVDWLEEEAKKRPFAGKLFSRTIAKRAVQVAIGRARAQG